MQNLSIHRTSELPLPTRRAVETLLGRALEDDEDVGVWASRSHAAPVGEARVQTGNRLLAHMDAMALKVLPGEDDPEQLADEIAREVRHGKRDH